MTAGSKNTFIRQIAENVTSSPFISRVWPVVLSDIFVFFFLRSNNLGEMWMETVSHNENPPKHRLLISSVMLLEQVREVWELLTICKT